MRMPHVDDRVRLLTGVPNTGLEPGRVGVVCSEWSGTAGEPVFEIEFVSAVDQDVSRRLIRLGEIEFDEQPAEAATSDA